MMVYIVYNISFLCIKNKIQSELKDGKENIMKKMILVLFMVFLCCGCGNVSDETQLYMTSVKEENIVESISNTIQWKDIQKMTNKDRIIQNADYIFVYDITDYTDKNIKYKYQYFIYNNGGTALIDKGIQGANGYVFEKISDKIIRGKKSLGSNVWESIYYNQKTGQKSVKYQTPIIEVYDYVGYLVDKNSITYLKVENMFNKKKGCFYKLGKGNFIPGILSATYKDGVISIKNGDGGKEINIKIENLIPRGKE